LCGKGFSLDPQWRRLDNDFNPKDLRNSAAVKKTIANLEPKTTSIIKKGVG
jgi:hypothetical protein